MKWKLAVEIDPQVEDVLMQVQYDEGDREVRKWNDVISDPSYTLKMDAAVAYELMIACSEALRAEHRGLVNGLLYSAGPGRHRRAAIFS